MKNKHILLAMLPFVITSFVLSASNFIDIKIAKHDMHQFLKDVAFVDIDEDAK